LAETDKRYDDWIRFYREEIFFYQVEKYEREQKEKLNSIK
jgi:3-phenylpropionate/cinnamic acid dioxygenase small subunit